MDIFFALYKTNAYKKDQNWTTHPIAWKINNMEEA